MIRFLVHFIIRYLFVVFICDFCGSVIYYYFMLKNESFANNKDWFELFSKLL